MTQSRFYNIIKDPIIKDPRAIELVQWKAISTGLKIELTTKLRHSKNMVFIRAKQITGMKSRRNCYLRINEMIIEKEAELEKVFEEEINKIVDDLIGKDDGG